jgi:hypothetical protein
MEAESDNNCLPRGGNAIYLKAVDCDANSRGVAVLYLTMRCKASHARVNAVVRGFAHLCAGYGSI